MDISTDLFCALFGREGGRDGGRDRGRKRGIGIEGRTWREEDRDRGGQGQKATHEQALSTRSNHKTQPETDTTR